MRGYTQNANGQPTTERKLNIHQISPVACLRSLIGLVLFAVDLSELFAFDRLLVDFVRRVRVCIILSYPFFFWSKGQVLSLTQLMLMCIRLSLGRSFWLLGLMFYWVPYLMQCLFDQKKAESNSLNVVTALKNGTGFQSYFGGIISY